MNWLVFIIASFCVGIGFSHAMFLERRRRRREVEKRNAETLDDPSTESVNAVSPNHVRDFYQSLSELTDNVNSNVDRHASQMAQISDQLKLDDGVDSATLLAAASQLIEANKQLKADLNTAQDEIHDQKLQITSYMSEARTDELTGLANRRAFDEELDRRLAQWNRQNTPVSLLLIDVDHFKRFNDYYGHQAGDATLQQVSATLAETMREMDMAARYGGEEFAVILPGTGDYDAKVAAERLRRAVAETTLIYDDAVLNVTVSVGLAQATQGEKKEEIIRRADAGLYAAKHAGRDCCRFHDGESCQPIARSSPASKVAAAPV